MFYPVTVNKKEKKEYIAKLKRHRIELNTKICGMLDQVDNINMELRQLE